MKNLLYTIFALVLFSACNPADKYAYYGEPITDSNAVNISELSEKMNDSDSLQIKLEGQIVETCAMKGCWLTMNTDNDDMRVTFKDYGFFVPKDSVEGKTVIIEGTAKKITSDVETLRHFAKDAGKSEEEIASITEPKDEITFVATGVIIKDMK